MPLYIGSTPIPLVSINFNDNGTGPGVVTQDEQGFLVLSNQPGGDGDGLEYEEGTWTPDNDIVSAIISFSKTHSSAPFCYIISDVTGTYDNTEYSNHYVKYLHWEQLFGVGQHPSSSQINYGKVDYTYRGINTSNFNTGSNGIYFPADTTDDSSTSYPRYWATETGIKAYSSASNYWRSGRTYKWIAIWVPST